MPQSKVKITVHGGDPVTDIILLDSTFTPLAKGQGTVQLEVAPGLYLARAVAGNRAEEMALVVRDEQFDQEFRLPSVQFDSPLPLPGTATSHEYHQYPVFAALSAPAELPEPGQGGFLLCVRDTVPRHLEETGSYLQHSGKAYTGFRLLGLEDDTIVAFDALPTAFQPEERLLLHLAQLPPGQYQLEWQPEHGVPMRIPMPVLAGMTTQLYVLIQRGGADLDLPFPDLPNAAVVICRSPGGFSPDSMEMRLAERLRYCLSHGTTMRLEPLLGTLLEKGLENPVTAVLAAHLLLQEKNLPHTLLTGVLDAAEVMLGPEFPDLVALRLRLLRHSPDDQGHQPEPAAEVHFPPLLRRSWDYLLEGAAVRADLLPAEGFASQASRSMVGNGIWLAYRPEQAAAKAAVATAPAVAASPLPVMKMPPLILSPGPAKNTGQAIATSIAFLADKALQYFQRRRRPDKSESPEMRRIRESLLQLLGPDGLTAQRDDHPDPAERTREFLENLVRTVDWDKVVRQLRQRGTGSAIAASLSGIEKNLLSSLRFARQHLEDGGEFDRRFVEGLARSLGVTQPVLRESLTTLYRRLIQIATGK